MAPSEASGGMSAEKSLPLLMRTLCSLAPEVAQGITGLAWGDDSLFRVSADGARLAVLNVSTERGFILLKDERRQTVDDLPPDQMLIFSRPVAPFWQPRLMPYRLFVGVYIGVLGESSCYLDFAARAAMSVHRWADRRATTWLDAIRARLDLVRVY